MVSPTLGGIVGGTGRLVAGLTLAPLSPGEQEREADRIGVTLAARAGWDPGALGEFLGVLERAEAFVGTRHPGTPESSATQPSTPERMATIEALALIGAPRLRRRRWPRAARHSWAVSKAS